MKVLILGAAGMLGHAVIRVLNANHTLQVVGTMRSGASKRHFPPEQGIAILDGVDVENQDSLIQVFASVQPNVVINCIGLVKQLAGSDDPLVTLPINAMLPHRLAKLCSINSARLIHVSTDCVFTGSRGNYFESDVSDATDLYGKSKFIGEISYANAITLRTSIIGHELNTAHSLIEWFLKQEGSVRGYRRAIFSGLPTVELARVIGDYVIPNLDLSGLYHVSAAPISKFDLLHLVSSQYGKNIEIQPDDEVIVDRSLNSDRFRFDARYTPPSWPELIKTMYESYLGLS